MNQESKFIFNELKAISDLSHFNHRLWSKVTAGLVANDMDAATNEKTFVENRQRQDTAARHKEGLQWHPRFFSLNKNDEYEFKGVQG